MTSEASASLIQDGARVIFQRKDWSKEATVGAGKSLVISKLKIKTDEVIGLPYGTLVELNKQTGKFDRVEAVEEDDFADIEFGEAGGDNRNLVDTGTAQGLSTGEIAELKISGVKGMELINNIVQNSSTFGDRQEYGKEKYVAKKKEKHIYRFRILRPTLRLACDVYSSMKVNKINHIRVDTLAIMLSLSNIQAGSKVLVVDGVQGLLLAAAMERTGGTGKIVHVHPGPQPIIPAYDLFGFPDSWTDTIHHLSIDNLEVVSSHVEILPKGEESMETDGASSDGPVEPPLKKRKLNALQTASANYMKENTMDALIMASRHHPKSILLFLLPFLSLSKNFVVHCAYREPLVDTFQALRGLGSVLRICLNDTALRYYQVLPSRTHPENSMSGSGGFLLSGTTVEKGAAAVVEKEQESVPEDGKEEE
ncbi:putative tRNA (adenine(58)-N(1))-methyltransferase non-catalytic subunit TRM6 [Hypsibius exemplaris]|uniref:tRNA (adenine(58)-N(1))-methyltransferase non-catalytic subunit TRM6 n=1 Tax=Hypsibius exemplaris TaxID=2072580 RepID=A0A9X6NQE3_HYPEX|nr:putative tRNA (adenine(58)-N(1))-methyltransferase non-catalytic subunit TRM6 [Hypsibius exemplaris]